MGLKLTMSLSQTKSPKHNHPNPAYSPPSPAHLIQPSSSCSASQLAGYSSPSAVTCSGSASADQTQALLPSGHIYLGP